MVEYDINGYRLFDRTNNKIVIARNVTFDECPIPPLKVSDTDVTLEKVSNDVVTE